MEKKSSKVFWFMMFGGLLGALLTSWLAPKGIAWYFDPPVDIGVNCKAATEWSMAKLQTAQFFGLLGGALMGLTLAIMTRRRHAEPPGSYPTEPQL